MARREVRDRDAERLYDDERYAEALVLLRRERRVAPDSHWVVTTIASCYYEQRRYRLALRWSLKARQMAPSCPLVLWHLAGVYDMLGMSADAARIYRSLIRRGVQGLSRDPCNEGRSWNAKLVNDCRYRLALTMLDMGRAVEAAKLLAEHDRKRRAGIRSRYTPAEVRRLWKRLTPAGSAPSAPRTARSRGRRTRAR